MQPDDHPTLLRTPKKLAGLGELQAVEVVLPLPVQSYKVTASDEFWFVTVRATGQLVYVGPGPAEVVVSRAPF